MAGEAISSSILLIGAAVGAAFLIAAILPAIFTAGDTFGTVAHSADEKMKTDFRIVNTFANDTAVKVWMKNVGATRPSIYDIQKSDVYYGTSTSIERYSYGSGGHAATKNFDYLLGDATNNGYWDIGETLEITIVGLSVSSTDPLSFTFATPNSIRRSVSFSQPT
jgi:archaeal flagellar protein FlaG